MANQAIKFTKFLIMGIILLAVTVGCSSKTATPVVPDENLSAIQESTKNVKKEKRGQRLL